MKIGNLTINGNVFLAPLAGYTDIAFRRLCRDYGATLTTTEMISVAGLNYRNRKTDGMTAIAPNENPSCVQLFGNKPGQFARAATHPGIVPFDIIDINMGCPMQKIVSSGEGCALMDNPVLAAAIVSELKAACDKPITVKMRLGMRDALGAVDFAKRMEDAGADMLTVHGRTAKQQYSGKADWDEIRKIAAAVSVPMIGNGDVTAENLADRRNGISGLAVGRGAIANPQIFGQKRDTVLTVIRKHVAYVLEYFDERYLCSSIRKFFPQYMKGIRGSKPILADIMHAVTHARIQEILEANKKTLDIIN